MNKIIKISLQYKVNVLVGILIHLAILLILLGLGYYLINDLKAFVGIILIAMGVGFGNNIERNK